MSKPVPGQIDRGIRRAVRVLQENHIETFESCEGGPGHAFPEPTIRFHGVPEAGWRALGICLAYGLPVMSLRRVWDVLDHTEPTGPYWELTFRCSVPDAPTVRGKLPPIKWLTAGVKEKP